MNQTAKEQENLLSLEQVSIDYRVEDGYLSAVHDVSFSMRKGEFFALVGESGCGKSTIAHSIMRLSLDHNERISGAIRFGGQDLAKISDREMEAIRGRQIGMIFQNPLDSLNPVYRAGTQVEEALMHSGMSREKAKKRTVELFADVQIPDPARRVKAFPHELSGGMRQRVMIAMMLAQNPSLLIADEPTTALDVTVEAQILEIMKRMRDKTGTSVLMIMHNFGIVAEVADRVGIMDAGELVEIGDVYQIFQHPAHPYSQALLGALPRVRKTQRRITTIDGTVPRIIGEPEDVVASLQRIQQISPFGSQVSCIESMDVADRDVVMHLSSFSSDLATALAGSFVTIMDKDEIEAKTDDELLWDCHPYGMYSIKEYVQGSHVVLTRNPGYKTSNPYVENKGAALIEEITVRFITEEFTAAQEANLGNVQYIASISPNGASQITSENMVVTQVSGTPSINYLEFNLDDPVTGDYNVRKAIALAIDREALAEQCNGSIVPAYSFVLESVLNHNAQWAEYYKANFCNNKDEAIRLLEEAGWVDTDGDGIRDKDGQPLSLLFISSNIESPDTIVAQALQIQMMDIGVWLQIDFQEDSYHYEVLESGEFQLGMERFGWSEPVMLLQWAFCWSNNLEYAGGLDAYLAIIDEMAKSPDAEKRTALVYECEKILGETIIDVPLFDTTSIVAYASDVTPPVFMNNGAVYFNDMK